MISGGLSSFFSKHMKMIHKQFPKKLHRGFYSLFDLQLDNFLIIMQRNNFDCKQGYQIITIYGKVIQKRKFVYSNHYPNFFFLLSLPGDKMCGVYGHYEIHRLYDQLVNES